MRSIRHVIFYALVFCLFPLTTKTATPAGTLFFFFTILAAGIVGAVLLARIVREEDHLNAILYILIGGILFQFVSAVNLYAFPIIVIVACCYAAYYMVKHLKKTSRFRLSYDIGFFLLISFLFLYIGKDSKEANSIYVIHPTTDDNYYFSALTECLINGSYWNAFLDTGAPLNYQITAFLLPANFARLSNLSGHISFWAYSMPFYKLISILTFAFSIRRLLQLKGVQPAFILTITGLLLFTFSSLNIVNLVRGKWSSLVFFAAGNFWPGGSPAMTLGFSLMTASVFLVLRAYTTSNLLVAGFCTGALMLTKIAMWLPTVVFLGIYALLHGLKKDNLFKLGWLVLCGILSCVLYVIFYTKDAVSKFVVQPFAELQYTMVRTFKIDTSGTLSLILLFVAYLFLSFGIRLIFLALPFFQRKEKDFRTLSIATILAVLVSASLMIPFKIYFYDLQGNIAYDSSYNLEQFLRSAYILVMISSVYLLLIYSDRWRSRTRAIAITTVVIYCLLIAYGNYTFYSRAAATFTSTENTWRKSVRQYFQTFSDQSRLLCMAGNSLNNKAHDLVADGIGPWWYSGKTNDGSVAYFFSTTNHRERIPVVDSLMFGINKALPLLILKRNNVTHLVVAQSFTSMADSLAKAGILAGTGNNYVYLIK